MKYQINGVDYEIEVIRKNNKNTYIRVNEELKIVVTANYLVSKNQIIDLISKNQITIIKMINKILTRNKKREKFYFLGKKCDIIIVPTMVEVELHNDKLYTRDANFLNKWLKENTLKIFEERLKVNYELFEENIPFPKLKIRTMKTRWGVCNRKDNSVTLNSELIRMSIEKLDYVIIHELSHFVHFDHSDNFWLLVSKYCPNYKKIRRELRS